MNKIYFLLWFTCILFTVACDHNSNETTTETVLTPTPQRDSIFYITMSQPDGSLDTIEHPNAAFYTTIQFPSLDSLPITANYYHTNDSATPILLCHQARWNKYEYDSIALVLQAAGYNCLALDQRSGGFMEEQWANETFLKAQQQDLPTDYLSAEQDIIAGINYLKSRSQKAIIIWGSSYSSTLALYHGLKDPAIKAVISFSPGDYFREQKGSLIPLLKQTQTPFFITSSKEEAAEIAKLLEGKVRSAQQVHFIPKGEGNHGARALWQKHKDHPEYWTALHDFLNRL